LLIAGAGMAGLVCASRARELGLAPTVIEKGTRAGGSMLLSSGVIWRHLEWEQFRAECPDGDPDLQRLIWERLDDALDWLISLGAEPVWQDTENPLTTGKRFDPRALTELLAHDVQLETPLPAAAEPPLVLATGGYAALWGRTTNPPGSVVFTRIDSLATDDPGGAEHPFTPGDDAVATRTEDGGHDHQEERQQYSGYASDGDHRDLKEGLIGGVDQQQ